MDITEVVMNPVRQRIIQYLMVNESATVKDMKAKLSDIPTPSLYRHVKILSESSVIIIANEKRVRGTVESTYQLNKNLLSIEDKTGLSVQASIMDICTSFAKYFAGDNVDPKKDMYLFTGCTLMLTDDEFRDFFAEIHDVANKYMTKESADGRRARKVSVISSPCE